MRVYNIVKYVFSIVGAGMLVGAFFWYNSSSKFTEKAVSTEGRVVKPIKRFADLQPGGTICKRSR